MNLELPIPDPPMPVFNRKVALDVKYVVVRGDGLVKFFDHLSLRGSDAWDLISSKYYNMATTILVPLDLLSAHRLGLVDFEEMQLPEAAQAFLHVCQPR